MRNPQEPMAQVDQLIAHVEHLRSEGDLRGAADHLREALRQGINTPEIRTLLAETQRQLRKSDEERAWIALIDKTLERIEEMAGRGELTDALAYLTRIEAMHGTIGELEGLRTELQQRRRQRERAELGSLLSRSRQFRDEGRLPEALREARAAVALDPLDREAADLVEALTGQIDLEGREAVMRRDLERIDRLLLRGRTRRAGILIRRRLRRHPDEAELLRRSRVCRRMRAWRLARRRVGARQLSVRALEVGYRIPVDRSRALARTTGNATAHLVHAGRERIVRTREALESAAAGRAEAKREASLRSEIARLQAEEWATRSRVEEARARLEELVRRSDIVAAADYLAQFEERHGALKELDNWREWLAARRGEEIREASEGHLNEARRLTVEDRLHESAAEARRALELEPENVEAQSLLDFLVLEIAEREFLAASHREAARIGRLLERGHLWQAQWRLRQGQKRFGDLPKFKHQSQRCRRLRASRWAGSWEKLQSGVASASGSASGLARRVRDGFIQGLGASAEWLWLRIEGRRRPLVRAVVFTASLVIVAIAVSYLPTVAYRAEKPLERPVELDERTEVSPGAQAIVADPGDLILDALPWGRVVSIVGGDGGEQNLGEELFTPVRLSLPAGIYRVVMENPVAQEPVELSVQVFAAGVTRRVYEFAPYDAEKYLQRSSL